MCCLIAVLTGKPKLLTLHTKNVIISIAKGDYMIGYVYKCEIANKIYIGKTSGKPLARYKVHLYNAFIYKSKIPIAEALRSVGEENALDCFSVIEEINGENWEELESKLCDRENYWMEKLGTMYPDGYNVNKSYPSKRITNHAPQKPREKVMRKVICIDTGEEFPSMAQAARTYGMSKSALLQCVKGNTNTASGLHWKYKDEEYHKSVRFEGRKNHPSLSHPVVCKETGKRYESIGEAARQMGICKTNIWRCAKGDTISVHGLHWGFVIDGKDMFPKREDKNKRMIMCIETGEKFSSITEAAKLIKDCPSPQSLGSAIRRGHKYKEKTYTYIDEYGNPVPSSRKREKV